MQAVAHQQASDSGLYGAVIYGASRIELTTIATYYMQAANQPLWSSTPAFTF